MDSLGVDMQVVSTFIGYYQLAAPEQVVALRLPGLLGDDCCLGRHGPPVRPNLWPVLASLPCPTLVVWGTESDVLSATQAQRMVDVLPRGELVAVPGVGHAPR